MSSQSYGIVKLTVCRRKDEIEVAHLHQQSSYPYFIFFFSYEMKLLKYLLVLLVISTAF